MKNIEKYKETKDALEAWDKYHACGGSEPFAGWAEMKYEEPRVPTLLEAAEAVKNTWYSKGPDATLSRVATTISDLADAIGREKAKPVRNCDRFATQEEAVAEFMKLCDRECEPYKDVVTWLYEKADKEKAK